MNEVLLQEALLIKMVASLICLIEDCWLPDLDHLFPVEMKKTNTKRLDVVHALG